MADAERSEVLNTLSCIRMGTPDEDADALRWAESDVASPARSPERLEAPELHDMMAQAELDAIRVRCEAATPGPWLENASQVASLTAQTRADVGHTVASCALNRDAEFIAASRSDIPSLLDEIAGLRRGVDRVRAFVKELDAHGSIDHGAAFEVLQLLPTLKTVRNESAEL